MNKNVFKFSLVLLLALSLVSISFAQRQTGSIHGTVVDEEGTPLPGATITISGPSLIGTKTYVTGEGGNFRFPALPPGTYEVRVEMPGFKTTLRKDLICNVGKTTECRIKLEIAALEEEVTVTAESPVVDVESSKVFVSYSSDFLANIPMARDLYDIQNSVPGAVSEGREYRRTSSILGGTVRSQLYTLDGVPLNDPATFYSMVNINVDIYEEVEFGLGALPAEVGQADSSHINIVSKSGGNTLSGSATVEFTTESFAQNLWSDEQIAAFAVDEPEKYKDFKDGGLSLGGPVIKDRLWFFINGRRQVFERANPYVPNVRLQKIADANPGMFTAAELQHYDIGHQEWMGFGKLTFQITNNLKYMGMLHYNHMYEPVYSNRVRSSYSWAYTAIWNHENTYATTHQFQWVLDQNTFFDLRGSYVYRWFPINTRDEYAGNYTNYDKKEAVYWGYSSYDDEYVRKRMMVQASATRFQDNFLGASHEIKAGVEFEQTEYHRDWYRRGGNPYYTYWYDFNKYMSDPVKNMKYKYYYSTSKYQGRLYIRRCPGEQGQWDVQDHTRRFSGFFQDSVTTGRLALNIGGRVDFSYQYEPEQTRPNLLDTYTKGPEFLNPAITDPNALLKTLTEQWHTEIGGVSPFEELTTPYKRPVEFLTFSPRIGIVYDIFGNGKTALKLSYNRYFEPVWSAKYNGAQIFGAGSLSYRWNDKNKNGYMDLPPTDTYELSSYPTQDPNYKYYVDELESPHMDEMMGGIEHELMRDFRLGLQFVYKVNKNIVEDVDLNNGYDTTKKDANGNLIWIPFEVTDPGWDGLFGTSDDKQITYYGLRNDAPVPTWEGINPPEAKRKYWAVILTFDKRMSNNWQLKGSILYSSFKGNAEATYGPTEGQSEMFDNPNVMVNGYGPVWFDRPLQIKLMGTAILPYGFTLSSYFQYRSGSPFERTFDRVYFPAAVDPLVQGSYVSGVFAEPRGSQRNRPYTNLDMRLEKNFRLGDFAKLVLYLDALNLGGHSGVSVNQDPYARFTPDKQKYELSTTYGLITSVYGVRSFRIGARLTF